jgi:hypothetical protein
LPDISEDTSLYKTRNLASSSTSGHGSTNYENEGNTLRESRVSKTSSLPSSFTYSDTKERGMRLMTNFDDVYDASEEENGGNIDGLSPWSSNKGKVTRTDNNSSGSSPRFKRLCVRIKNHPQYKKKQNVSFL